MVQARPRRALPAPIGIRVVRIAGPAVAAGALITTVAVGAWSSPGTLQAAPADSTAPSVSATAQVQRGTNADRGDRSQVRPALAEADEKVAMRQVARQAAAEKVAEQQAAAKQKAAAKAKAERKEAAVKRAAEKKAAEKRAAEKKAAEKKAAELDLTVIGSRYTTAALKLRTEPAKDAKSVDVVDEAKKVKITDTVRKGYRLVVVDGKGRWVTSEYLSKKKPSKSAGISSASCHKSSGIESGLVANGKKVYRAICAAFPEVSSYGGRRGGDGGFHGTGQAVDAMISDSQAGWRLANWVRDNASRLGVSEVIYSQKIWTVQRSGEGWRGMSDRGSATANHYDHVHVSVY